jgi:hypothetical protein
VRSGLPRNIEVIDVVKATGVASESTWAVVAEPVANSAKIATAMNGVNLTPPSYAPDSVSATLPVSSVARLSAHRRGGYLGTHHANIDPGRVI